MALLDERRQRKGVRESLSSRRGEDDGRPVNEKPKLTINSQRASPSYRLSITQPTSPPAGQKDGARTDSRNRISAKWRPILRSSVRIQTKLGRFNLLVKAKKKTNVFVVKLRCGRHKGDGPEF